MNGIIFIKSREQAKREKQVQICTEYANNHDIEVLEVFEDFRAMVKYAAANDIKNVIVTERSRLTRDALQYHVISLLLAHIDTNIICVNEENEKQYKKNYNTLVSSYMRLSK